MRPHVIADGVESCNTNFFSSLHNFIYIYIYIYIYTVNLEMVVHEQYTLFQKPGASIESRHCGQDKRIFLCPVHNASTPCSLQAFGIRCIYKDISHT